MNIGEFKNINGQLLGSIATSKIDLPKLGLKPVNSNNVRAPAYEIVTLNVGKRWVQIGALWEATSNGTGEVFLQGQIEDPSFDASLPIALFSDDDGGYRVAWSRPKPQRSGMDGPAKGKRSAAPVAAFGEGTADDNGQVTGERELDDQIPF